MRNRTISILPLVLMAALQGTTGWAQIMLPPDVVKMSHPLAKQIESVLQRQAGADGFVDTGLKRDEYLRIVDGQVKVMRTYQNREGRIIDPVTKTEFCYATPCYAHSVATLVASGYNIDSGLIDSGRKAMDVSVAAIEYAKCANNHGDFYTYPVMLALEQFREFLPAEQIEVWRKQLARMNPSRTYRNYNVGHGNWGLVNTGGEFMRSLHGMGDSNHVDKILKLQRANFTVQGLYRESGNPFAYDAFSRYYLTGMLHRGYHGESFEFYRDELWKGAWTSLLIQSPFGELPTCYRSAHHIWNEAQLAKVYEVYAVHYARAGRFAEAGAFKRGARLALRSVGNWIRPDGSGYVVKNRYPIEARHGYEQYSAHSCYNMLACSMLCTAWQYADDSIAEKSAPADLGGFVVHIPEFDMVVANAGGTYVQYMTKGNQTYNPTGIIRVHLRNGHPQLGPSEGVVDATGGAEFKSLSVGPAWLDKNGSWTTLAAFSGDGESSVQVIEERPETVAFDVKFSWHGVHISDRLRLDAGGLRVEDEISGKEVAGLRIYFPMLVFDGLKETSADIKRSRATLMLDGRGIEYAIGDSPGNCLVRMGRREKSRNGMIEPLYADVKGLKAAFSIRGICESNRTGPLITTGKEKIP